jgi:hypothetical protein
MTTGTAAGSDIEWVGRPDRGSAGRGAIPITIVAVIGTTIGVVTRITIAVHIGTTIEVDTLTTTVGRTIGVTAVTSRESDGRKLELDIGMVLITLSSPCADFKRRKNKNIEFQQVGQ